MNVKSQNKTLSSTLVDGATIAYKRSEMFPSQYLSQLMSIVNKTKPCLQNSFTLLLLPTGVC